MLRVRSLLGLAVVFSAALALKALFADQPTSLDSPAQPEKAPEKANEKTVTLSQKEPPTEETIRKALQKPMEVKFEEVPLNKFVASLAKATGVNLILDEAALVEEGLALDEPITRQGDPIAAARLLDRVLEPLDLTWMIEDGVVQITTLIAAEDKQITRIYAIGDLMKYAQEHKKQPDDWYLPAEGAGGLLSSQGEDDAIWLIDTLQQLTDGPWVDLDGTGGTISYENKTLVIRQTHKVQHQCAQVIDVIREFTQGDLKNNPTAIRPAHYPIKEDEAIKKALRKVISVKAVDVPLQKYLADIARTLDVPLFIFEQALTEEGVALNEPINRELHDLPARSLLRISLEPLGLAAIVENGQLLVSTSIEAEERLTTKVYDIRDLYEAGYKGSSSFGGYSIVDLLQQETSGPWVDIDGTGGTIGAPLPGLLIVWQTDTVQTEIEDILADLRNKMPKASPENPKQEPVDPQAITTRFYLLDKLGDPEAIQRAVLTMVEPDSWRDNQPNAEGRTVLIDSTLVVKNRGEVQAKVLNFLQEYRANVFPPSKNKGLGQGLGNQGLAPMNGAGGGFFRVPPRPTK